MAERLSGETFKEKAFQPGKLTLIDFYSDSCVPCKRMVPVLAKLEEKYGDQIFVGKVNVAYEQGLVEEYSKRRDHSFRTDRTGECRNSSVCNCISKR